VDAPQFLIEDPNAGFRRTIVTMSHRQLHPREESYRWAIERLEQAFGPEKVNVIPRNHYHVLSVTVSRGSGRPEEITLRTPTQDINKDPEREQVLERWITDVRKRFKKAAAQTAAQA
jgi:hypothetical protein